MKSLQFCHQKEEQSLEFALRQPWV